MFHDPVFFHGQYSDCKQADIESSYNIRCPKITLFTNPQGVGRAIHIWYMDYDMIKQAYHVHVNTGALVSTRLSTRHIFV